MSKNEVRWRLSRLDGGYRGLFGATEWVLRSSRRLVDNPLGCEAGYGYYAKIVPMRF